MRVERKVMILRNKTVVITGGVSGIGFAVSKGALSVGAKVAIFDINEEKIEFARKELTNYDGYRLYKVDITNENQVKRAFDTVFKDFGRIDGLVNCAGIALESKPSDRVSIDEWNKIISVNLTGVFLCTKHAIPYMIKNKNGSIVNISSVLGKVGEPDDPAYCASKGGVTLLTKSDALSYAKYGIRINSVHPGHIRTPMLMDYAESAGENFLQELVSQIPLGRLGNAEEVADAVLFLLSDYSSYVTGSEVLVDGGFTAK